MQRLAILTLCVGLTAAAPPPKQTPAPASPPALAITEDDRDILLGFEAQRIAALAKIEARQTAYLKRLAARLGVRADDFGTKYRIDLDELVVKPIASEASKP